MNSEAVGDYVEQSKSLLETSPQMDEENTKVKLIQPFIELLGWDFYSTEVELEYTVQMGTRQPKVDYALMIGDAPVAFIEAKSARSDLTEGDLDQLRSYMRQKLSVDWGVLTNGKHFEILVDGEYNTQDGEVSIGSFDLEDMTANPEPLEILTRDTIQSERAKETARQIIQINRAIQQLNNREESIAERLTDVLQSELGDTPLDFDDQSLEFLEDLRDTLRGRRSIIGKKSKPSTGGEEGPTKGDEDNKDNEDEGEIEPAANNVAGTIRRENIEGLEDAEVAVFPTRESGLPFLKENNAWGFVRVGREFDYVAMYVTRDAGEVRYFATVRDIVAPDDANLVREPTEYVDRDAIEDGKIIVQFETDSLYRLENPIPYETEYPQSRRYTTLGEFRTAETTDDML